MFNVRMQSRKGHGKQKRWFNVEIGEDMGGLLGNFYIFLAVVVIATLIIIDNQAEATGTNKYVVIKYGREEEMAGERVLPA
ncbi:hypothetical protein MTO96_044670 [Rhipicephalus appendiculatus]